MIRPFLLVASLAVLLSGCDKLIRLDDQPPDAPAPRHIGERSDAKGREGNSFFDDARYTDDGALLVTLRKDAVRVWDAKTGKLQSSFTSQLAEPGNWMLDSRARRFVGRNAHEALEVFDLETGKQLVEFPAEQHPPNWTRKIKALALGADTSTVILGQRDSLMLWGMFPPRPLRSVRIDPPEHDFVPRCAGMPENAGKKCWERSPDGHWLALAFTSERSRNEGTLLYLVNAESLIVRSLKPPDGMWRELEDRAVTGFAFSGDSDRLAIGTSWGVWVYEIGKERWQTFISGKEEKRSIWGPWAKLFQRRDDKPGLYLGAMAFTGDGKRVVALGNGMKSYVFDASNGRRLGTNEVAPNQGQGTFRISANGSRMVIFRQGTSLLEVRDGHDASQVGWICPTACMPSRGYLGGWLTFAVSPDGRSVAASLLGRGSAVYATDTDALLFPLNEDLAAR